MHGVTVFLFVDLIVSVALVPAWLSHALMIDQYGQAWARRSLARQAGSQGGGGREEVGTSRAGPVTYQLLTQLLSSQNL